MSLYNNIKKLSNASFHLMYGKAKAYNDIKSGIWLYFFLLIFEGALRRWVLPGLASPLLIIRDPIALWVLYKSIQHGIFPSNIYVNGIIAITIIGVFTALLFGHGNIPIALYGARIYLIHFPLMFVIGKVFTREDVLATGRAVMWIMLPMTILIILQFYSPQSAWVNRGVGGNLEGAGFSGALGYMRPPATFSFILGTSAFFSFAAAFVVYFWFNLKQVNRLLLLAASVCVLLSIPFSVSRSLVFNIVIIVFFALIAAIFIRKNLGRIVIAIFVFCLLLAVLNQIEAFRTGIEVLSARFTNASESEGGLQGTLGDRFLGGMIGAITDSNNIPFFGYGIGLGTNVGAVLLTGHRTFVIAEVEWGRVMGEQGILFGLLIIVIRTVLSIKLVLISFGKLRKGDMLSWLLISTCLLRILQSQWAQPTALGFSTLFGGLIIASFKISNSHKPDANHPFAFKQIKVSRSFSWIKKIFYTS